MDSIGYCSYRKKKTYRANEPDELAVKLTVTSVFINYCEKLKTSQTLGNKAQDKQVHLYKGNFPIKAKITIYTKS